MKILHTKLLLIFCTILLFSCKGKAPKVNTSPGTEKLKLEAEQKAAKEALYDEVIAIHDAVMPKMSDINRVKRSLKAYSSSLKPDKCGYQADDQKKIRKMVSRLDAADESMMEWMRNFKQPEGVSHEEMMQFLESERTKISEVSELMLTSLADGEKLLEMLPKQG